MDRSRLVPAAAVICAVLAVVLALREELPTPSAAPPEPAPVAAPVAVSAPAPESPLPAPRTLRVHGEVTNPLGLPVPGVRVSGPGSEEVFTGAAGAYELELASGEGGVPELRFSATGYREARLTPGVASAGSEAVRLDVRLDPAPGALVSGTLVSERGAPIAGESIRLERAAAGIRHAAVSGVDGSFSIPGVEPADGYYLSVRPARGHRDFQRSVDVGPDGLSLEIALRELSTARLRGRLVDPAGRPVPELGFSVVSGQALGRRVLAASDADGYFAVDGVPTGHLSLFAHEPEPLVVSGVLLAPGSESELVLRVDWGGGQLRGRVVDEAGRPVGGAEVELSWSHVGEGAAGRSQRSALTDAGGAFEFRRLAEGIHRLAVRAPGYREVELDTEVGPGAAGLEVALEPARGAGG